MSKWHRVLRYLIALLEAFPYAETGVEGGRVKMVVEDKIGGRRAVWTGSQRANLH